MATLVGALGLFAGAGLGLLARRSRDRRTTPSDDRHDKDSAGVTIVGPPDGSIQPCGPPITFRAMPAGQRAEEITWSVSDDATFAAHGPTMQYRFRQTGVYQVVARSGSSSDDVIVYAYKTPSSRTTLADLLQADPAPGVRVAGFVRHRVVPAPAPEENG